MKKIKVLIIDDSAMVRKLVTEILSSDPSFEVVGTAANPLVAREKIKTLNPDVLTLDVEMPKMDGLTFLRNLMRLRPMPVVMLSTLTAKGTHQTLEALNIGAVDFVCKPKGSGHTLKECAKELISKIKNAANANLKNFSDSKWQEVENSRVEVSKIVSKSLLDKVKLISIGASTGGTEAIRHVLERLPEYCPPLVIAQHIPKEFSGPFASRMNSISALQVKEAEQDEIIKPGHAYLAPGSHHLTVKKCGINRYRCCLDLNEPVNRHRPSVDVLFDSVSACVAGSSIGVLLTGMGKDGAGGLARMHAAGAATIAQDEATSVVWGMPGEAVKLGAADYVLALDNIAGKVLSLASYSDAKARQAATGT
ncbi:MAG: chemotaxis-specific protein-glutamate methyltransferase CheB [Pseudomonadales bacterium]|nr:chemotaxis-specific protein-glutamate methyltransferase CheB [Pseudomonadales bacterium]